MVALNLLQAQRCSTSGSGSRLPAGRCLDVLPRCGSSVLPFFPIFTASSENMNTSPSKSWTFPTTTRCRWLRTPSQEKIGRSGFSCSEACFIQTACCSPIPYVQAVLWKGHYVHLPHALISPQLQDQEFLTQSQQGQPPPGYPMPGSFSKPLSAIMRFSSACLSTGPHRASSIGIAPTLQPYPSASPGKLHHSRQIGFNRAKYNPKRNSWCSCILSAVNASMWMEAWSAFVGIFCFVSD